MRETRHDRHPELEILDPTAGLTGEDLDEIEKDPSFQRMADETNRAERESSSTGTVVTRSLSAAFGRPSSDPLKLPAFLTAASAEG